MSKIDFVGVQTQSKLLDISAAAHAVGISGISVAHNSISTGAACSITLLAPWRFCTPRGRAAGAASIAAMWACT